MRKNEKLDEIRGFFMSKKSFHFYRSTIINPIHDKKSDLYLDGILVVANANKKSSIVEVLDYQVAMNKYKRHMCKDTLTEFKNAVMLPTFFDMHFHWVQDDVRQMPKNSLLDWLDKYTFPTEAKFKNKTFSKKKAKSFFSRLVKAGTLGGACFSSVHEVAIDAAMKEVRGDFVIGNVVMDMYSPKYLTQKSQAALKLVKKLIQKYKKSYCFTPRFAITTSPETMKKGSRLADKAKCFKQSHLSETLQEIDFVLSIYKKFKGFSKVKNYTEIYKRVGMLGKRSLMGHAIHLSKIELKIIKKTKTNLVHCPTSNAPLEENGLDSGLFNFRKVDKAKISWALGSDIGAGPILSMLDVMKSFVHQNIRHNILDATYLKALYHSTLAGAKILGLGKKCGNFKKGKDVNFLLLPLIEKVPYLSAEQLLKVIIEGQGKARSDYDDFPTHVFYQNKCLYKKLE